MTKQLKNLDDALINQVEVHPNSRIFKFGNCHKVTVIASVKIPAQIGEKTVLYKKNTFKTGSINTEIFKF